METVVRVNAADMKSFDETKFTPKPVYQSEGMKVVLAYFKPGQFIPVHSPQVEVVLCILEGEAEIVAGDERVVAKKHDLIVVPKGNVPLQGAGCDDGMARAHRPQPVARLMPRG